jgi:ATP-dependent protease HslVU (ClpYQ) peptidase subunit
METYEIRDLKRGDKITIAGDGLSARGHVVIGGLSVKTGRKMNVKTLRVYVVTEDADNKRGHRQPQKP